MYTSKVRDDPSDTVDRKTFVVKIISRWWLDREIKTHENFRSTKCSAYR